MEQPTSYSPINQLLDDLLRRTRRILGEQFIGLYLYGSLAAGDFDPRRSDIDFIVVTRALLPASQIAGLEAMHQALWAGGGKWAAKLEGQYIPLAELRRHNPRGPRLPTVNEGRFYLAGQGSDWVLQRHILREQEAIVAGPSLRDQIDPVSGVQMREAVCDLMRAWWAPMVDDPAWLDGRPEYQAFAVQTMCRVLYTLQHGEPISKTAAAAWAMEALDEAWSSLIADAIAWPDCHPTDLAQVLDFIRFTAAHGPDPG